MPSYSWTNAASGNWSTIGDWTPNGVPGALGGDTATISVTGADYIVDYDEPLETINNLTINSANATLAMASNTVLNVNNSTTLQAGTIDLENGADVVNIGTLGSGNLSTSAGSVINIGSGSKVTYYSATLGGLIDITGITTFGTTSASITLNGTIEATSGGVGTVNFASLSGTGILEANGASMFVSSSLANSSVTAVISNSTASVFETTGALFFGSSVSIQFLGANGEFQYNNAANDTHVNFNITGLNAGASPTTPTNFIGLAGEAITVTSGSGAGATGSVVLSNGDTLALSGITGGVAGWAAQTASDGNGGTDIFLASVCYAAGTRILTPAGERVVESLAQGDVVSTLTGDQLVPQRVKWLGHRRVDLRSHPRPASVAPVRIRRGAFADAVPHRDLLVSPNHGILIDGRLVCARQLMNGATIAQDEDLTSVEYFHVELDSHAILLAEGLPAESYLDTGNRGFFVNSSGPTVLHPDLTDETGHPARQAGSCVPFVSDEASVRPMWRRLAERAASIGQPVPRRATTTDAGPRLLVDRGAIKPFHRDGDLISFLLPRGAREVRLVSRAQSPTVARPWLDDSRRLGVCVNRIVLRGAEGVREIPVDHPDLTAGWWEVERGGLMMSRWTDGEAVLPLPPMRGPTMLEIHLAGAMTFVEDTVPMDGTERRAA